MNYNMGNRMLGYMMVSDYREGLKKKKTERRN